MSTYVVGIDLGSTATKVAVLEAGDVRETFLVPTGYSSVDAASRVRTSLEEKGFSQAEYLCIATGYGRGAVDFADKTVTEITCHAKGAYFLFQSDGVVVDVGGQDTKVIVLVDGKVSTFVMNDKCSAGTGKFLEVMANRLGVSQEELSSLAKKGTPTTITSLCTVFAETEVISLIGQGTPREDIAYGVVDSVVSRVGTMMSRYDSEQVFLTGGLCENAYFIERLSQQMRLPVHTKPLARYAGAIGAALCAGDQRG